MAPHSSTLAWKFPWTEEPGRLQSMGLPRVRHNRVMSLSLFTFLHWRRKWQPTPVFWPGESQEQWSLVGCCLWGRTELDTTEVTQQQQHLLKCLGIFYHEIYYLQLYISSKLDIFRRQKGSIYTSKQKSNIFLLKIIKLLYIILCTV